MKTARFVFVTLVLLALLFASALPAREVTAANASVSKGDFWEYQSNIGELIPNITSSGPLTLRMEVIQELSQPVPDTTVSQEVWRVGITGSLSTTINVNGTIYSPNFSITGSMDRLSSNFSIVNLSLTAKATVTFFIEIPITLAVSASASPPIHDYIGTDPHVVGTTVTSRSSVNASESFGIGFPSIPVQQSENVSLTLTVVRTGVSVTVPAGTFDCVEVKAESRTGIVGNLTSGLWYYSTKVGNYVKLQGADLGIASILGANATLVSYSHRSNAFSLTSGTGLIILIVVIVAIVAIVTGVLMMRKKGGAAQTVPPPHVEPPPQSVLPVPPNQPPIVPPPGPHQHQEI